MFLSSTKPFEASQINNVNRDQTAPLNKPTPHVQLLPMSKVD